MNEMTGKNIHFMLKPEIQAKNWDDIVGEKDNVETRRAQNLPIVAVVCQDLFVGFQ